MKNCIRTPNLVCGILKLIFDANKICKNFIKESLDFLERLFYLFFIYHISQEFKISSNKDSPEKDKGNRASMGSNTANDLKEIESQNEEIKKTMKHLLIK